MPKRGINIHKRNDGRREGRYKVGVKPNGTTKYALVYENSYSKAKEKLVAAMAEKTIVQSRLKKDAFQKFCSCG